MVSLEILALILLFAFTGYFSAAEIAMTALNRYKIAEIAELHPFHSGMLERWKANPSRLLTTIIVCSNLTVIAFSSVATAFSFSLNHDLGFNQVMVSIATIGLSILAVLLAEIAPKIVAKRHPERVALLVLPGLSVIELMLGPLIRFLMAVIRFLLKPFGIDESSELPRVTQEDLVRIVDEGARGGVIEKEESEMIQSIIQFGDTVVREVMIPRTEMLGVSIDATVEECHAIFIDSGYSRLPVFGESLDEIRGIVYAKDFLSVLRERELIILRDIIRPAFFVPESKKVADLLREFKKGKVHIAIVVDEYGGTAGLVTLEDLVEEIVGEIRDEYDLDNQPIRKQADGSWEADGSTELDLFCKEFKVAADDRGESTTLAGFVAELASSIPRRGDRFRFEDLDIEVLEASERRVDKLRIRRVQS